MHKDLEYYVNSYERLYSFSSLEEFERFLFCQCLEFINAPCP